MDITVLSRMQFAITTIYHFLFVPLTIGLSFFVAVFETVGYAKKDTRFSSLAAFFGKLFLINFALGVVTGIVQEFEFGMNWSQYSAYVGDIFGAPLAVEALAAFFLESTFIGIWLFGKDRIAQGVRVVSIWLVAFATCLSALWILVANAFMQDPTGYALKNGRAVMTNFGALISNPAALLEFAHTVAASFVTAAFFIIGVSALKLLWKKQPDLFAASLKVAAVAGAVSLIAVAGAGDAQGKNAVRTQPMKMAAAEALWNTESPAGFNVIASINQNGKTNTFALTVPDLLSFLSYGNLTAPVQGINQLEAKDESTYGPGNYTPPVPLIFWSFRGMLLMAGLMALLCLLLFIWWGRKKIAQTRWLLLLAAWLIPAPFLSNIFGWIVAEVGRQPWIVYGLLKVNQGVSPNLTPGMVLFTIVGFLLIYTLCAVVEIGMMIKYAKKDAQEA